jgi:choline dehydrogenase
MQDHYLIRQMFRIKNAVTMNEWVSNPLRRAAMGAYYLLTRRGPMGTQPPQLCAFTRTESAQDTPNIQYILNTTSSDRLGFPPLHSHPGFTCAFAVLRPQSIGYSHVKSADPMVHPAILHNFLQSSDSHRIVIDGVKIARKIVSGSALAGFEPEEIGLSATARTDEEILGFARQTVVTVFHQSGTCKMGPDSDRSAVVDERLRVRGLQGLRVVDASIMPNVVSGNTNVPTMMIAEKASQMIKEDRRTVGSQNWK